MPALSLPQTVVFGASAGHPPFPTRARGSRVRIPTAASEDSPYAYGPLVGSAPPLGAGGFSPGSAAGAGGSFLSGSSLPKKSTFGTRSPASAKPTSSAGFVSPSPGKSSYRGVRQRPWGKVRPPSRATFLPPLS